MARRPLLEAPAAARAADAVMKSFVETDRLLADAQGQDIVGLEAGEPFDPIGDLDKLIAEKGQHARTVRLPRGFTLDEMIEAIVTEAPSWGFDRAGTRGFLDGAASTQKTYPQKLATTIAAAGTLGYRIEVKP